MYVHKRTDRNGQVYYSFSYVDEDGKRIRLKKSEHPHFSDHEAAQAWALSQEAQRSARKARHERKLAWRTAYFSFEELADTYTKWQAEKAPNSYRQAVADLTNYVYHFFLVKKHAGNPNNWHLFYQEFVDWLREEAMTTGRIPRRISKGTANNIIRALNTFLVCLHRYGKLDPDNLIKCTAFPEHQLNHRGFKDVIQEDEFIRVRRAMAEIHQPAADFFTVLWHTGMRFSELFGLPITALFKGTIPNIPLHEELSKSSITYHGYLYLDSQPYHDDRKREEDGSLRRKPLKSHKSIGPKSARIIPIRTAEVWNILASRYKEQSKAHESRIHTKDKADYVFFEDLEWNKAVNTLRKAYERIKEHPKQYHCCRHSFTTRLVGETRSFFLVRSITGHRKDKSFERYLHIYEQIALDAQQQSQEIELIV